MPKEIVVVRSLELLSRESQRELILKRMGFLKARSRMIAQVLGFHFAALWLRQHGVSFEAALWILLRKEARDQSIAS